jgi:hypothetical protein
MRIGEFSGPAVWSTLPPIEAEVGEFDILPFPGCYSPDLVEGNSANFAFWEFSEVEEGKE